MAEFHVIIPARYGAVRLPGKPLLLLAGHPLVEHVWRRARAAGALSVTVATDDERIVAACRDFGGEVVMTDPGHVSGTDRLAECAEVLGLDGGETVVNLQGDEPLTPPEAPRAAAAALDEDPEAAIATLSRPIEHAEELHDPSVVKVVTNARGRALYFSRAPIPWHRAAFAGGEPVLPEAPVYQRHLGIYAYRVEFLHRFRSLSPAPQELAESLEQLRALHHGERIQVRVFGQPVPAGVDTEADLARVEAALESA